MKTLKKQILQEFHTIGEADRLKNIIEDLKHRIASDKRNINKPEKLKGNIRLTTFKEKRKKRIAAGERALKYLEQGLKILIKYYQMEI